ncbi:fatty acid hydroxylase domain-containing protein 2 isoform X2 [Nematostella vectensis]|uniref:fatty acid hydroxylase domain-containing protein 2 isoform X2 n=1 Tax=Nematostella vectensis TaxID=45351 RepID=UPI0020773F2A|nr:fatty acid hydroxylase domain-containing protein 2 isoform X2 [Nematostella vectensis]
MTEEPQCQAMSEPDWAKPRDPNSPRKEKAKSVIESLKKTAFVLGTALICFAAARNSITWHVERFWGASGDFWQTRWRWILDLFGHNDVAVIVLGTTLETFFVFWFVNAFFLFIDITGRPKWALKYKIQDGQNMPVDKKKLIRAIKVVLFNQLVVGVGLTAALIPVYRWRGCSIDENLPSFHWVLFEIACFTLVEEFGFYYSHRLAHHPKIYKYIHKQHHEWTAPIGIVSIYAHPLEHLVSNLCPIVLGPLLMGSHIATAWLWFSIALTTTNISHSGYHFPFLPSPEAHDFHHLKFNQNYGVLGVRILETIFSTPFSKPSKEYV